VNALCTDVLTVLTVALHKEKAKVLAAEAEGNLYQVITVVLSSIYVKH
jgi:hypothetical protein